MRRYGDVGKAYGFGVYGGLDETIWCPPATPEPELGPATDSMAPVWQPQNPQAVAVSEVTDLPLGECTDVEE